MGPTPHRLFSERVFSGAQEQYRHRGKQVKALQFDLPAAVRGQGEDLVGMRQADGKEHIDNDQDGADPKLIAGDHQQRAHHLAEKYAEGEKLGQAVSRQHALDAFYAMNQLGPTMKENQDAQRQAQDQFAHIGILQFRFPAHFHFPLFQGRMIAGPCHWPYRPGP